MSIKQITLKKWLRLVGGLCYMANEVLEGFSGVGGWVMGSCIWRLRWSLLFLLLLAAYFLSACGFPAWRDQTLRDVAEGRRHVDPAQVPPGGTGPSQTTEFYGPGGQHLWYGKVQDRTVKFFNVDGSRVGFGKG